MPSADETTTYLFKVMPETTQDFLTHDVDLLVSQIKENLRLSGLKAKSSVSYKYRPSPYLVRSRAEIRRDEVNGVNSNNNKTAEDDPYEKLRELLKQGRLINEAVKKLQTMNFEDLSSNSEPEDDQHDDDDEDDLRHHRGYRRKTYYYDSEDEPLPAVFQPLDL